MFEFSIPSKRKPNNSLNIEFMIKLKVLFSLLLTLAWYALLLITCSWNLGRTPKSSNKIDTGLIEFSLSNSSWFIVCPNWDWTKFIILASVKSPLVICLLAIIWGLVVSCPLSFSWIVSQ